VPRLYYVPRTRSSRVLWLLAEIGAPCELIKLAPEERKSAEHLARHPLQKVSAMKLLITAEKAEDKPGRSYSFRMGVKFTKRPGNFDSSGECNQITAEVIAEDKAQLGCAVDCDGGGISVELTKENKTTLVRLDRIRIWRNNKPEEEGLDLSGGADDRIFRLDRASLNQCKTLVTDRKELAAMRTLKK